MKLKLDQHSVTEEFFEDCHLIGIVAPIKEYSFIWHINQKLGLNMRINNGNEIQLLKKKRTYFFSIFEYKFTQVKLEYYVYCNKHDGEYLLPEFKHLDFVWLIKGEYVSVDELKALMHSIKALPGVQLVNEMTNEKIKHKQHLIF